MKLIKFVFILYTGVIFSQKYMPIDTADKAKREIAIVDFRTSTKTFLEAFNKNKDYPASERKVIVKNYEEFFKNFEKEIKEGRFYHDSIFLNYAYRIVKELKKDNPEISTPNILISKDPTLNAFCLPDGTFVLNAGLFYWLDNDDQFAWVVSHEMSHKLMQHSIKKQLVSIREDKQSKKKGEVKNIQKQKYNRYNAAFDLLKEKLYAKGELSKKNEYQADSLGVVIIKKSSFKEKALLEALKLMETYDTIKPKGVKEDIYRTIFNLPTQPFKEEWLQREDFSQYDYSLYKEKINKDSLSTHPETENRINMLETIFPELKDADNTEIKASEEFNKLQQIAKNEQISSMYFFEQYGAGIYLSLIRLQNNPEDEYYLDWLGKCFEKIYEGRKTYKLNRYLDKLEPKEQSESYQQFLNFMWNLSLDEIKNIAEYYSKKEVV